VTSESAVVDDQYWSSIHPLYCNIYLKLNKFSIIFVAAAVEGRNSMLTVLERDLQVRLLS